MAATKRKCVVFIRGGQPAQRMRTCRSREEAERVCKDHAKAGYTCDLFEIYTTWTPDRYKRMVEAQEMLDT